MDRNSQSEVLDKDELLRLMRLHATPIDYEALIRNGIIEKHGSWYKVLKFDELPEHARRKGYALKQEKDGLYVKFRLPSKSLQKFFKD